MTVNQSAGSKASSARVAICGALTAVGVFVAAGTAFNLWLQTVSFGGPEEAASPPGVVISHVLVIAVSLAVPVLAFRILMGKVPAWLAVIVAVSTVALVVEVIGVA